MADNDINREIFSAALSAHVSELKLFWRETGISCRWLVPDSEHCYVDESLINHLKAFKPENIDNEEIREEWVRECTPLLESDDAGSLPFSLKKLTWILRVVESPHRDDLKRDSWNLYLWNIRMVDLPNHVANRLKDKLDGDIKVLEFDTVITKYV